MDCQGCNEWTCAKYRTEIEMRHVPELEELVGYDFENNTQYIVDLNTGYVTEVITRHMHLPICVADDGQKYLHAQ